MQRASLIASVAAAAAAIPAAGVATRSIYQTVKGFSDPCAAWGVAQMAASVGPNDPCRAVIQHGASKFAEAMTAALVPGGILAFALLAVAGAMLSRRRAVFAGAIGMLVETVPAFTIAPLTLAAGLVFLLVGWRVK